MFFGHGYVEVLFPNLKFLSEDLKQISYDQYKIELLDEPQPGSYTFQKKFRQKLKITAQNFKQFINSSIIFKYKAEM